PSGSIPGIATNPGPSAPTDAGLETGFVAPKSRSAVPLIGGALAVLLLGGGIALAVALTRGNDSQQPVAASTAPEAASDAPSATAIPEVTPAEASAEATSASATAPSASTEEPAVEAP